MLLAVLLFSAPALLLQGQQFETLNLTVNDPQGNVLPQASVSVRNEDILILNTPGSVQFTRPGVPSLKFITGKSLSS
jgi:hypothetical protein